MLNEFALVKELFTDSLCDISEPGKAAPNSLLSTLSLQELSYPSAYCIYLLRLFLFHEYKNGVILPSALNPNDLDELKERIKGAKSKLLSWLGDKESIRSHKELTYLHNGRKGAYELFCQSEFIIEQRSKIREEKDSLDKKRKEFIEFLKDENNAFFSDNYYKSKYFSDSPTFDSLVREAIAKGKLRSYSLLMKKERLRDLFLVLHQQNKEDCVLLTNAKNAHSQMLLLGAYIKMQKESYFRKEEKQLPVYIKASTVWNYLRDRNLQELYALTIDQGPAISTFNVSLNDKRDEKLTSFSLDDRLNDLLILKEEEDTEAPLPECVYDEGEEILVYDRGVLLKEEGKVIYERNRMMNELTESLKRIYKEPELKKKLKALKSEKK